MANVTLDPTYRPFVDIVLNNISQSGILLSPYARQVTEMLVEAWLADDFPPVVTPPPPGQTERQSLAMQMVERISSEPHIRSYIDAGAQVPTTIWIWAVTQVGWSTIFRFIKKGFAAPTP